MAKLPSKEELEQLYRKWGKDALVWYAWRNALRALPLLGGVSPRGVWGKDAVRHIYTICRINFLLTRGGRLPTSVAVRAAAAADDAATRASTVADDAAARADAAHFADAYFARAAAYASAAAAAAARVVATARVVAAADAATYAVSAYDAIASDAASDSTRADFNCLIERDFGEESLFSLPLWSKKQFLSSAGKQILITEHEQHLLKQLRQLNLESPDRGSVNPTPLGGGH